MSQKLSHYVAKQIVLAQTASDGGKVKSGKLTFGHWELLALRYATKIGYAYFKKGYLAKDWCILKAIEGILRDKNSGFTFYITRKEFRDSREKRSTSFVIYFNFRLEGRRLQVSFHSFSDPLWDYYSYGKRATATRWLGRSDSRESCLLLAKAIRQK
jgi:hypothetical protein